MADVTARSERRGGGRGQLLLLGGIVLAMIFVGIALVLNGSIYAENLATRQSDGASSDIQTFQGTVADAVAGAIGSTNQDGAGEAFTTLRDDRYRPRVDMLAEQLANRRSLDGEAVRLTAAGSRPGTQLVDDDASSDLTPRDATTTTGAWTMVAAAHVRAFEVTAEPTASDSATEVTTQLTGGSGDAFEVTLTPATGPAHEVAVYEDGGGTVRVAVSEVGSGVVRECIADGGAATVALTGRPTVDGTYCDALDPVAEADGTYEVRVTNGDLALGTYRLVVDRTDGPSADEASLDEQVDRANYDEACSGTTYTDTVGNDPYSVPAIYAGTVDLRYRSQQAESEATLQVVPEQAGDSLSTPLVASLDVADTSATDGDASFTVDWTVEDPDGDLDEVTLELVDSDDTVVDTADDPAIGGESAMGDFSVTDSGGGGGTYDLVVTVSDGTTDRTRTVTHAADGDTDPSGGCPL